MHTSLSYKLNYHVVQQLCCLAYVFDHIDFINCNCIDCLLGSHSMPKYVPSKSGYGLVRNKKSYIMWGVDPPCHTWFLGHTRVYTQTTSWLVQPFLYGSCLCPTDIQTHRPRYIQLLHPFYSSFSWTTWVSQHQKGKTSLDLNEARDDGVLGCSGISWAICKQSAPCSRQITTPTPQHSIFTGRMLFLMPNHQCQSTEGTDHTTSVTISCTYAVDACNAAWEHKPSSSLYELTDNIAVNSKFPICICR